MSISNLLVPNDYLLYINSNAATCTMFKCTLVSDQTVANNTTITLGATSGGGSGYLVEWNLGGFTLDNTTGSVTVPKTGKYAVIIKITYQNGSVANAASNDNFSMVDSTNAKLSNNINYVNAVGNATMQRNFTNVVQLTAGVEYRISATIGGVGLGSNTYKGDPSLEYCTWSFEFICD